jgi:hypothetical protein
VNTAYYSDYSGYSYNAQALSGYPSTNFIGKNGNSYYQFDTWLQSTSNHGLYFPSSGAGTHFYPAPTSYGSFRIIGSKGGYTGFEFYNGYNPTLMFRDGDSLGGVYQQSNGVWQWYYDPSIGNIRIGGNYPVWHSGNDGSGSGLEADTLDGWGLDSVRYWQVDNSWTHDWYLAYNDPWSGWARWRRDDGSTATAVGYADSTNYATNSGTSSQSWLLYDAYRGSFRYSNDLYVSYAYDAGNANTLGGWDINTVRIWHTDTSFAYNWYLSYNDPWSGWARWRRSDGSGATAVGYADSAGYAPSPSGTNCGAGGQDWYMDWQSWIPCQGQAVYPWSCPSGYAWGQTGYDQYDGVGRSFGTCYKA